MTPEIRRKIGAANRKRWAERKQRCTHALEQGERKMQAVSTVPPHADWQLVVKRQITANGKVYPVNSVAPATMRNVLQMIEARFLVWSPPQANRAVPFDLPPPAPTAKPRPAVEIIHDRDPVESFRKTKARLVDLLDGDSARALDILLGDPRGVALWKVATGMACAAEAKRRKVISVCPSEVPL